MRRRYLSYKSSGIERIGDIPASWNLKRFKYFTVLKNGYAFKSDSYVEEGIPLIRIGDVQQSINLAETKKIPENLAKELNDFLINKGDILVALTGATIGKSAVYNQDIPALLNQRVAIIRPTFQALGSFLKYISISALFLGYIDYECYGGAQENIGKEQLGEFRFPLPPVIEQEAIATYLDKKTTQIDKTIQKKQRLIELLQEEQKGTVNKAVTQGIDDNVRLKKSGEEWLGDIPQHWMVKKLKYLLKSFVGGGTPATEKEEYWKGEIPWVSPKDMKVDTIKTTIDYVTEAALKNSSTTLIDIGRVLIVVRSGILKHSLPVSMNAVPVTLNQDMKALEPNERITNTYLFWMLKGFENVVLTYCKKIGATVDSLDTDTFINLKFAVPPLSEQSAVVNELQKVIKKVEDTIKRITREIDYLNEYRTALINEVVTGKVCVV